MPEQNLKYRKCCSRIILFSFYLYCKGHFKHASDEYHILTTVMLMWKVMGKITQWANRIYFTLIHISLLILNNCNLSIFYDLFLSDYRCSELPAFKMNFINGGIFFFPEWSRVYRIWRERAALQDQLNSARLFFSWLEEGSYPATANSVFCCYPQVKVSNEESWAPFWFKIIWQQEMQTGPHSPRHWCKFPFTKV